MQCDNEFWPYEKRYLFDHLYNFTPSMAMPEESLLTMEEVRLVCDYENSGMVGLRDFDRKN